MHYQFDLIQNDYTICPPGWGMTQECATFHRIYYVCGGEAYRREGERDIPLEKGYLYIFPVMEPYTLWHNPDNPLEVLWFHVEIGQELCMNYEKLKIDEGTELYFLLAAIRVLQRNSDNFEDVNRLFDIFLKQLSQLIDFREIASRRMRQVLNYMEECSGTYPTVAELAAYAGMDRSYFTRQFQRSFHMSPRRYLLAKRMNQASKALIAGKSVWEAARLSGYEDEKAFSRAFKAYMEISPSDYRRKHVERL